MSGSWGLPDHGDGPGFDRWLRFDPATQQAYDAEHGEARARHLSLTICLGLVFYNLYNITSLYLHPDILLTAFATRLGLVTPASLALAWLVLRRSPSENEQLVLFGMIGAFSVPVFLFWFSAHPYSVYSFLELPLTLFFGGLILSLRFRQFVLFMAAAAALALLGLALKSGMEATLKQALGLQYLTGVAFVLAANYVAERQRCRAFVETLISRHEASSAKQQSEILSQLSYEDGLTGIANRRRFDAEWVDYLCSRRGLGLLMMDIDHFKLYNDTYGHQQGDRCLTLVAEAIASCVTEPSGFAARIGGEEFSILFECDSEADLSAMCRRVLHAVRALERPHAARPDEVPFVTLSVGACLAAPGPARSKSAMMSEADEALYDVKHRGRDGFVQRRLCLAPSAADHSAA